MDADALSRRFPWMNVDDLAAGCLGLSGAGWFDPYALLMACRAKARAQGAVYETGAVAGLAVADRRVSSVRLADGRTLACGEFVNATGPAAARTAALAGITLPVECRKRCVFVFDCRRSGAITHCPLVIDPSGVYFRPEGQYFITGVSPPADRDPECWDFDVDHTQFDDIVWPVLARRAPAFEAIKVVNAWAGHYAYNVVDQNAVLGRHPEISNFIFANGFSGHGLQQAPAVGRGLAELIIHGGYRSLDLSAFRFERFAENRLIREANVV
jgi:glycine/D-amino acid oxidase-like deaminating enzyme